MGVQIVPSTPLVSVGVTTINLGLIHKVVETDSTSPFYLWWFPGSAECPSRLFFDHAKILRGNKTVISCKFKSYIYS